MNQVEDIEVILTDLSSGRGPCFQNNYTGSHLNFIKEWLSFS